MTRAEMKTKWPTCVFGDDVTLGNDVELGDGVKLGNYVTLGDGVKLGDRVKLGYRVTYRTTPAQVQCHPYIVYPYSLAHIGVGCIVHPIEYWDAQPAELKEHPECLPWENYHHAIALVRSWIERQKGGPA